MRAAMAGSSKATVMAVGWPWATSMAKLGPLKAPMGSAETDLPTRMLRRREPG